MRRWAGHAIFAALLVGSLAMKAVAGDRLMDNGDLEPAVMQLAQSRGLAFREIAGNPHDKMHALVFDAPGCATPIVIAQLDITFEQAQALHLGALGYTLRYAYLDRKWTTPDHAGVFMARMETAALGAVGLTRLMPSWHMLAISYAPDCHAADAMDWSPVWDRDFRIAN